MLQRKLAQLAERLGDVRLLALVGADGVAVQTLTFDTNLDPEAMVAGLTTLARDIVRESQELAVGTPRQLSVSVDRKIVMLSFLSRDYCLLLVADEAIGHGRARFELRRARLVFEDELS